MAGCKPLVEQNKDIYPDGKCEQHVFGVWYHTGPYNKYPYNSECRTGYNFQCDRCCFEPCDDMNMGPFNYDPDTNTCCCKNPTVSSPVPIP